MLKNSDFILSATELDKINELASKTAKAAAREGCYTEGGLIITFEFSPFGRNILASCSGGPMHEIS